MKWDDQVDTVCTGAGAAGLASAIAAVDLGGTVFVADSGQGETAALSDWLDAGVTDAKTSGFFAELVSDLGPVCRSPYDLDVPVRAVLNRGHGQSGGTLAPFVGSRLRDWAARCLATPYGYLYTRVPDWHSGTVHTADGEIIEVAELGVMTPDLLDIGGSVLGWLAARAVERHIEVHSNTVLQRIVFEDGVAVGAVFDTARGPLAIRARNGVTVSGAATLPSVREAGWSAAEGDVVRICLVGQHASRFGRVELLSSEATVRPAEPPCRVADRRVRAHLHDTRGYSRSWRCGKVHGHPSPGQ